VADTPLGMGAWLADAGAIEIFIKMAALTAGLVFGLLSSAIIALVIVLTVGSLREWLSDRAERR
jgi:preprotein translocase subunit SecF